MRPTNHTLIITIPGVKRVTGRIISVKPMGPGAGQLVVETIDVLPYREYEAVYTTPNQEAAGTYQVFRYGAGKNFRWWSSGIFRREKGITRKCIK